ncbi:leucine-rich repeat-containing protein 73 isoform X2 [Ochotona princeps]|uniref:leucine-rich repeat-containing protein 73 isoform X2 n=1 Tax=Ochotona princeps TaxID=9978 RepID=UPI0027145495|nr:leucine-rich repeat-containing protein 73 isoform X2 [Ochotona princeps]
MLPSSIQISGEPLSGAEVRDICRGLRDNAVRLLSLRGCRLCDRDFGRICRALAGATSLAQLNLNLGVVSSPSRIKQLAEALRTNRSIQSLFLHGSPLTDAGLALLNPALALHPALVALDLGDCMLGDEAINLICGLLPPDGAKSGDHVAGMLAVAVASSRTLEVLDLEGTGLTNQSAQTLLDMVENYPTALRSLVLAENSISPELQQQICDLLSEGEEEEEVAGGPGDTQEWEKGREPAAARHQGSSSWRSQLSDGAHDVRTRGQSVGGDRDVTFHLGFYTPLTFVCVSPTRHPGSQGQALGEGAPRALAALGSVCVCVWGEGRLWKL